MRYYASARAAAGVTDEQIDAASLETLRKVLTEAHGDRFARVLAASAVLVDGRRLGAHEDIPAGSVVEVLPPFAGG